MENSILVLRTSISTLRDIELVNSTLTMCKRIVAWNIDFEDWEKILRIECRDLKAVDISNMLKETGIAVSELEYLDTEKEVQNKFC